MSQIKIIESWTSPAKDQGDNEDGWGVAGTAVSPVIYVIDGCTDYARADSAKIFPGGTSSAWWHKEQLAANLKLAPWGEQDLYSTMYQVIENINLEYRKLTDIDSRPEWALPCSTLVLVEYVADKDLLRIATIGDTSLLLMNHSGEIIRLPSTTEDKEGEEKIAELLHIKNQNEAAQLLRRERRQKFIATGRHCISLFNDRMSGLTITEIPTHDFTHMLLATDGFMRLTDVLNRFDHGTLLESIAQNGLKAVGKCLRSLERNTPPSSHYSRIKAHDDATAVYVKIGN
jgi:hypothetical protein